MDYAKNLRLYRKTARLTQHRLSQLSGVPAATIASWEVSGANPRAKQYDALIEICKKRIAENIEKDKELI